MYQHHELFKNVQFSVGGMYQHYELFKNVQFSISGMYQHHGMEMRKDLLSRDIFKEAFSMKLKALCRIPR